MADDDGKDVVVFVDSNAGDLEAEYTAPAPLDPNTGDAVGPNGQIDWDCPCLQGMADGPCGERFKEAFSCFVFSQEPEKGSECADYFKSMHQCLSENAEYYGMGDEAPAEAESTDATSDAPTAPTSDDTSTDDAPTQASSPVAVSSEDAAADASIALAQPVTS